MSDLLVPAMQIRVTGMGPTRLHAELDTELRLSTDLSAFPFPAQELHLARLKIKARRLSPDPAGREDPVRRAAPTLPLPTRLQALLAQLQAWAPRSLDVRVHAVDLVFDVSADPTHLELSVSLPAVQMRVAQEAASMPVQAPRKAWRQELDIHVATLCLAPAAALDHGAPWFALKNLDLLQRATASVPATGPPQISLHFACPRGTVELDLPQLAPLLSTSKPHPTAMGDPLPAAPPAWDQLASLGVELECQLRLDALQCRQHLGNQAFLRQELGAIALDLARNGTGPNAQITVEASVADMAVLADVPAAHLTLARLGHASCSTTVTAPSLPGEPLRSTSKCKVNGLHLQLAPACQPLVEAAVAVQGPAQAASGPPLAIQQRSAWCHALQLHAQDATVTLAHDTPDLGEPLVACFKLGQADLIALQDQGTFLLERATVHELAVGLARASTEAGLQAPAEAPLLHLPQFSLRSEADDAHVSVQRLCLRWRLRDHGHLLAAFSTLLRLRSPWRPARHGATPTPHPPQMQRGWQRLQLSAMPWEAALQVAADGVVEARGTLAIATHGDGGVVLQQSGVEVRVDGCMVLQVCAAPPLSRSDRAPADPEPVVPFHRARTGAQC
jgi:hypothetical protein